MEILYVCGIKISWEEGNFFKKSKLFLEDNEKILYLRNIAFRLVSSSNY